MGLVAFVFARLHFDELGEALAAVVDRNGVDDSQHTALAITLATFSARVLPSRPWSSSSNALATEEVR